MMKKLFFLMLAVLSISICTYAQLKEVRGILTQQVNYDDGYFGYQFTNENNYSVWIEAELWFNGFGDHSISDTKSFTLKPRETYLWKNGISSSNSRRVYVKYKAYKAE